MLFIYRRLTAVEHHLLVLPFPYSEWSPTHITRCTNYGLFRYCVCCHKYDIEVWSCSNVVKPNGPISLMHIVNGRGCNLSWMAMMANLYTSYQACLNILISSNRPSINIVLSINPFTCLEAEDTFCKFRLYMSRVFLWKQSFYAKNGKIPWYALTTKNVKVGKVLACWWETSVFLWILCNNWLSFCSWKFVQKALRHILKDVIIIKLALMCCSTFPATCLTVCETPTLSERFPNPVSV